MNSQLNISQSDTVAHIIEAARDWRPLYAEQIDAIVWEYWKDHDANVVSVDSSRDKIVPISSDLVYLYTPWYWWSIIVLNWQTKEISKFDLSGPVQWEITQTVVGVNHILSFWVNELWRDYSHEEPKNYAWELNIINVNTGEHVQGVLNPWFHTAENRFYYLPKDWKWDWSWWMKSLLALCGPDNEDYKQMKMLAKKET